jgi:hypothetical protein
MDSGVVARRVRRIGKIGWIYGAAPPLDHAAGRSPIVGRSCARSAPSVPAELIRAPSSATPTDGRGDAARRGSDSSLPKFDSASGVLRRSRASRPAPELRRCPEHDLTAVAHFCRCTSPDGHTRGEETAEQSTMPQFLHSGLPTRGITFSRSSIPVRSAEIAALPLRNSRAV